MQYLSCRHFPVAVVCIFFLFQLSGELSPVHAQFPGGGMPSSPSPGGSGFGGGRSSSPRPGGFNSGRPNTGRSTPGRSGYRPPTSGGNYGRTPNYGSNPNAGRTTPNYGAGTTPNYGGANRSYGNAGGSNYGATPNTGYGGFQNPFSASAANRNSMPGRVNSYGRTTFDPAHVQRHSFSPIAGGANPFGSINSGLSHNVAQNQIDTILNRNRNLNNLLHATSTAAANGLPSAQVQIYRNDAMSMARQQIQTGVNVPTPYVALARFSLEDNKMSDFRKHTKDLINRFPEDKHSRFFNGVNLLDQKNWKAAEKELRAAKAAGMPDSDIAGFLKMAIDNQKWIWEYAFVVACIIGAWLLGMIVLYFAGLSLSKSTVKMIESDPNIDVSKQKSRNRIYRLVSSIAGIYYFISLPVVVLLAIALPLALVYGALSLPFISLPVMGLVLVGGFGGIMTAISGLRASFVRIKPPEIERKVSREEAPGLWALSTDVAEKVGTRPIDEIWLFGSTDLAVTEEGSFFQRVRDKAKRVLVLGTGAIEKMDQGSFRAVLAHEYGHFQNRDTAGGDVSMRVNGAMDQFIQTVVEKEKIRWWDVAVRFLKTYYVMFNRITFGARRLQEVMADRVAVKAYGAPAFQRGLTHVIRRSLESQLELNQKLDVAMQGEEPSSHSQDRFSPFEREQLSHVMREIMKGSSSEFDAHPSPKERLSMTSRLNDQGTEIDADKSVWALFSSSSDVQNEMASQATKLIADESDYRKQVIKQQVRTISRLYNRHKDPMLLFERAQLKAGSGDFKAAVKDVEAATGIAGDHLQLTILKAIWQKYDGDFVGAIRTLKTAKNSLDQVSKEEKSDENLYDLNMLLGEAFEAKSMHDNAIAAFKDAAGYQEKQSYAMEFSIGKAEMNAGRDDEALARFQQASEFDATIPESYYYCGLIHSKRQDRDKARTMFQKAESLDAADERFRQAIEKLGA